MADTTYPPIAITQGASEAQGLVQAREVYFVETASETHTGAIAVPAGAWITDIIVQAEALWTAATSASLEVGDGDDPDGFYTAVDLKATDLIVSGGKQTISFATTGGVEGAYLVGSATHWTGLYNASARTITATIAKVGSGTAGRTRMIVVYVTPSTSTLATSVA